MKNFEFHREIFIDRLKEFIDERSVLAISELVGIPERTIHGWLRKETTPSMEYLIILAQKMKCSIDYLVGLEN